MPHVKLPRSLNKTIGAMNIGQSAYASANAMFADKDSYLWLKHDSIYSEIQSSSFPLLIKRLGPKEFSVDTTKLLVLRSESPQYHGFSYMPGEFIPDDDSLPVTNLIVFKVAEI